jgi:glycosyltransferase involved in cell wall biosynthesis
MKLFYVPVERYKSRWTEFVSGIDGMFMHKARTGRVLLQDIEIIAPHNVALLIESGVVLDTKTRADWSFKQILALITYIQDGTITSDDIIYFEDFWTPGMEMIPYACHLAGIRPKVYAFCHAQSVDPHDFTYPMASWMRPFEQGWARWLTGIFVAARELKIMLIEGQVCEEAKIHVTGTVMARSILIDQFYAGLPTHKMSTVHAGLKSEIRAELEGEPIARRPRKNEVLFSSRLNKEKNPDFFLQLAKEDRNGYEFTVLSGRDVAPEFLAEADKCGVTVLQNISKLQYYEKLCTAKVMFNCADQDFVSYGLLEALAYGCFPLLPKYLTFPDAVGNNSAFLYIKSSLGNASSKLDSLMELPSDCYMKGDPVPEIYRRYGDKYEDSVDRMVDIMTRTLSLRERIQQECKG